MKLTNEDIKKIEGLIQVCMPLGIDMVLINDEMISGINDEKSCILVSSSDIPAFDGNKICLSRLGVLNARLNLLKNGKNFSMSAKENDKKEISQIELSNDGAKVQFRCMSPNLMKAPKGVNDPANWVITITKEELEMILGGVRVMGAKRLIVSNKSDGCYVECSDVNNDIFSIKLSNNASWAGEEDEPSSVVFAHYYATDVLLPLLKMAANPENQNIDLVIGELGTLSTVAGSHPCTIIPQVES